MPTSKQELWAACLNDIRAQLAEDVFRTWFTSLSYEGMTDNRLRIGVPNDFLPKHIEGNYGNVLRSALEKTFGPDVEWAFVVRRKKNDIDPRISPISSEKTNKKAPEQPWETYLNPDFTFENFVEGESNRLARSIGLSIAKQPGRATWNPFFVFGPSGVGKTHLATAIGNRIVATHPEMKVLFVNAMQFRTQFTDSVLQNTQNDFLHFYQSVDVLIVDDIQEFTTAKTQQAFFHVFNHLSLVGKQIVLTCDKAPAEVEGMEERMLSRFNSGIVGALERPDFALRKAILLAKIKRDGLSFPKKVVDYIAERVESNVRELQGVVNSIMAYSLVHDGNITEELAHSVVGRIVNLEKKEISAETIIRTICRHYGLKQKDLLSKSRKQDIVKARHLTMYLIYKYTGQSYQQIGLVMGKRDHSTVLHACNAVNARILADKFFRAEVESVENELKQ